MDKKTIEQFKTLWKAKSSNEKIDIMIKMLTEYDDKVWELRKTTLYYEKRIEQLEEAMNPMDIPVWEQD